MKNIDLLDPVQHYNDVLAATHEKNIHDFFEDLVSKSGVDADANRKTVQDYKKQLESIKNIDKKISKYKILRTFLIIFAVIGIIVAVMSFSNFESSVLKGILMLVGGGAVAGVCIWLWFGKVNKILKDSNALKEQEEAKADELLALANEQMAPLNALFNDTDTFRIIEKTLPEILFDNAFSKKHEELFNLQYDFVDIIDGESSVIDTVSGSFCKNPFLYFRYKAHEMGTQTYQGSLTIHWTETYRDSNGNLCTRNKSQTLYATVEKPKPYYNVYTSLGYGAQAAPNLNFSRNPSHIERLNDKEIAKRIKAGEKELQKQAKRSLKDGGNFQEMANSEFDVLFGANDRDNEVEFRLLFTPLAQTNMVKLMRDHTAFGDDFHFFKFGRYNIVRSEHAAGWDMSTTADNYYSYDIDEIRAKFLTFNASYFKSVFFDFAPFMTIAPYLDEPVASMEPPKEYDANFTYYEHEIAANALGSDSFAAPDTITDVILKTQFVSKQSSEDIVNVTAYSYYGVDRVDYVPVLGGDGHYHNVPVQWVEYVPTEKTSTIGIKSLDSTVTDFKRASEEHTKDLITDNWSFTHGMLAYLK